MADGFPGAMVFRNSGAIASARDLRGRFQSLQSEVLEAHLKMATKLQELQAAELEKKVQERGRPQRGTDYLIEAIQSEGNRTVSRDGFTVGNEGFLNSTKAAPYWRHIEEGYAGFVGRTVYGFFRTGDEVSGPTRGRLDREMIQTSAPLFYDREGTSRVSKSGVYSNVRSDLGNIKTGQRKGNNVYRIRIGKAIQPYRFMQTGIEQWQAGGYEEQYYREALSKFQGLVKFTTSNGNVGAVRG